MLAEVSDYSNIGLAPRVTNAAIQVKIKNLFLCGGGRGGTLKYDGYYHYV